MNTVGMSLEGSRGGVSLHSSAGQGHLHHEDGNLVRVYRVDRKDRMN